MKVIENFLKIKNTVFLYNKNATIIVVCKNHKLDLITPLIDSGHEDFGENKVKEAVTKWKSLLQVNKKIKLHMIGNMQSNKVDEAVQIFDYVHSLDSEKLANKFYNAEKKFNKRLKYFIQVNIGNEPQKSGINENFLPKFVNYCVLELKLNIIGLMCIPPLGDKADDYFNKLKNLNIENRLQYLSMGMSSDYVEALKSGSNFIRVGSAIFNRI
jgi:pyridoxal phosphate enzyme (YggS family)